MFPDFASVSCILSINHFHNQLVRRCLVIVLFMNQAIAVQYLFFFQAEDGIRDLTVTGVQTCALPIWGGRQRAAHRGGAAPGVPGAVVAVLSLADGGGAGVPRLSVGCAAAGGGVARGGVGRGAWWGKGVNFGGAGIIKKKKNMHGDGGQ